MTPTPPSEPPEGPQDPDPPDLDLIERAARRLRLILRDPDRSRQDKIRAIDALGRVLIRLKKSL
jgi:hypothetical protein